jgi:hypothetical protein
MSNLVVHNLIVISLTILVIGVLKLVLNWVLDVFFKFGENLASKYAYKLLFRGSLFLSEVIMVIIMTLMITSINKKPIFQVLLFFSTFLVAILIGGIRQQKPESFSIFKLLPVFPNTDTYITNRAFLLINQFSSVMSLFVVLVFTYTFFTLLEWPTPYYFVLYIALPVYLSFWVYFSMEHFKLQFNDENNANVRRFLSYILLAMYTVHDLYGKFYLLMNDQKQADSNAISFFLYSATVIFIALERVLRTWTDDYRKFKCKPVESLDTNN